MTKEAWKTLRIQRVTALEPNPLPTRAHRLDAGLDLFATHFHTFKPGARALIETGIRIWLPVNTVGMICPRSGLAYEKGLTVLNAPGIIDQGYHGEILVNLVNHSSAYQHIEAGDRIAQLVITPVAYPEIIEVDEDYYQANRHTTRGSKGHGSTGK